MKMLLYQIILLVLLVYVKDSEQSSKDDILTALQNLEILLKREISDVHDKLNHMSDSIETLQDDLSGIVTETQSMNFKLTELEENCSLIENTTKQLENTDQCPSSEGFILSPNGDQCFKRAVDQSNHGGAQMMSWDAAVSYCREYQLELAGPVQDHNAVWLQQTLQDKYGDRGYYWLNCRGSDDGVFTWRTRGDTLVLPSDNPLWLPGEPYGGFDSTRCVVMTAESWNIEGHPGKLYGNSNCSWPWIPLCERIMETQSMNFKLTELEENCSLNVTCQNETISKLEETGKNITDTLPNLKLQGEPVGENTTKQLENTDQCPLSEGFILSPTGDQCFKRGGDQQVIWDQLISWDAAVSYCRENQLELAGPVQDHNAAWLQKTLQDKYGDNGWGYWLNCRGNDDGVFTWRTRGDTLVLPSDSPLWLPGEPHGKILRGIANTIGSTSCVVMTAYSRHVMYYPGKLYVNDDCSTEWNRIPLCERIMQ